MYTQLQHTSGFLTVAAADAGSFGFGGKTAAADVGRGAGAGLTGAAAADLALGATGAASGKNKH